MVLKNKYNIKIALDLDGVIIQIMEEWCRLYNELYPTRKPAIIDQVHEWDFWTIVGCTKEECYDVFKMIEIPNVPIINKRAPKYIKKIYKRYPMDIVTARFLPERDRPIVKQKLDDIGIFRGEHYDNLVVCSTEPKDLKFSMDYDLYIDDSPNLAERMQEAWNNHNFDKFQLMPNRPWNWRVDTTNPANGVLRIKGLKEAYKLLK